MVSTPKPRRQIVADPSASSRFVRHDDGFTLVEVLVALAVLAVAAAGLVGAAEAHVDTIRAIQARAAAQWVAENRIVELTVGADGARGNGSPVEMLGERWTVQTSQRASDDPEISAMTISVAPVGSSEPLVTMDFFLDRNRSSGQ